jgi:large subunit ribosomal protein L10
VLTEYRGLTVAQLKELRRSLQPNATYAVVKNTLTKIAARDAGVTTLEPMLEGPSAIAFVTGDAVEVAKSLRDFGRTHPLLVVKGGVLDGRAITADEVRRLADLESREVLLSKLAGAMKGSLQQAVSLFAAPLSQMARLMGALEEKARAEAPAEEAAAPAEEAPAAVDEAPAPADDAPAPADEAPAPADDAPAPADEAPAPADDAPATADAEAPSDGTPGVEQAPDTAAAEAADDDGAAAQAVADATDVPPNTDVAGDATSAS